ncbi:MAG: phenylalanine--tRNA ligase subunit beta, partial [Bowdeniella nasicola]|nr:phenylalanine--tRNA ligase subunit beta [Bowdeniella nasicola]
REGEQLTTLDDVTRTCSREDLLITDSNAKRPLGFAGVMGAANTEVSENTTAVLIEAAHFDPVSIARTARRHRLPSEAAKRFERGVDPQLPPLAAQRVVELLETYAGGQADSAVGDINETQKPAPLPFAAREVVELAGIDLPSDEIKQILIDIGCQVSGKDTEWQVTPPTWRPDLGEGCTLVEEVARIAGYDKIPSIIPAAQVGHEVSTAHRLRRTIARTLAEHGMEEVLSFPFTGPDRLGLDASDPRQRRLKLANALADDAPYLRSHLLSTLIDTAVRNHHRGADRIAVMELGMVVIPRELRQTPLPAVGQRPSQADLDAIAAVVPHQPWHVAGVLAGPVSLGTALTPARQFDWADAIELAKLAAESVGAKLDVSAGEIIPFHPGRCARLSVGDLEVGYAGELHPRQCENLDLPARTVAFELDLDALFTTIDPEPHHVAHVSTFPMAKEDFAFVVDDSVTAASVIAVVKKAAGTLGEDVRIFDIYRGEGIGSGRYSIAVAVKLRAGDHTLTAEEIHRVRNRVIQAAETQLGAQLRS